MLPSPEPITNGTGTSRRMTPQSSAMHDEPQSSHKELSADEFASDEDGFRLLRAAATAAAALSPPALLPPVPSSSVALGASWSECYIDEQTQVGEGAYHGGVIAAD